ncbi:hypothetical protein [Xenorhabdus szentirmaii]|uniref:hypothetical protein n=1 Tax=Xenorhabdus szentirmaii TaxID=290112 RepID=UPI001990C4E8|nr:MULTISPECIES: hypothetical protein [unclassified Xenorhabdus]MBD2793125.1 hypothetical protein [Xenorhabdus sp. CUL]MBD2806403.1 hypothetical protein [Xenorhabdus sp. ZM]
MAFCGFVSRQEYQEWKNPTSLLPCFHFYERHESKKINAPAKKIIQEVKNFNFSDDIFINILSGLRNILSYFFKKTPNNHIQDEPFGLNTFTLLSESDNEISMGSTGRFWRADLGIIPQPDLASFMNFNDDSAAKLVLHFFVKPHPDGYHSLVTETFIFCPNKKVKTQFTPYWLTIGPA